MAQVYCPPGKTRVHIYLTLYRDPKDYFDTFLTEMDKIANDLKAESCFAWYVSSGSKNETDGFYFVNNKKDFITRVSELFRKHMLYGHVLINGKDKVNTYVYVMVAIVALLGILSVGAVISSFTRALYQLWSVTPRAEHVCTDVHHNIMVDSELPENLGYLEQYGDTDWYDCGGMYMGTVPNETRFAGWQLLTIKETGQTALPFFLLPYFDPLNPWTSDNGANCSIPGFALASNPSGDCPTYNVGLGTLTPAALLDVNGTVIIRGNVNVTGILNGNVEGTISCGIAANYASACSIFQCYPEGNKPCAVQQCKTVSCNGGTCIYTTLAGGCSNDSDCSSGHLCNTTSCSCYNPCSGVNCATVSGNPCGIYDCFLGTCTFLKNDTGCCTSSSQCAGDGNSCDSFQCVNNQCFRASHVNDSCSINSDCYTGACNTTNCTCYDPCASIDCSTGADACTLYECRLGHCIELFSPIPGCCTNDTQCSDGLSCTTDKCNLTTHTCSFTVPNGKCSNSTQCSSGQFCDSACTCITPVTTTPTVDNCVVRGLNDQTFLTVPRDITPDSSVTGLLASHSLEYYQWEMGSSVSINGNWLATNAPYLDAVFLYYRGTYGWSLAQTIERPSNSTSANYGVWAKTVSLSGNMLAIGHCTNGTNTALPAGLGLVTVYTLSSGTTWAWQADIPATSFHTVSNEACIDGASLFWENATYAILGAQDTARLYTYVFSNAGTATWTAQISYSLTGVYTGWASSFSGSVATSSSTGNFVGVGGCVNATYCQVLVFYLSAGTWALANNFVLTEPTWDYPTIATADGSAFGSSLSIYEPLLLVGAPHVWYNDSHDVSSPRNKSGAAALYYESSAASWSLNFTIYNPEAEVDALFGASVGLSSARFAVGAPGNGGTGSVWVYMTETPYYGLIGRMKQQIPQSGSNYGETVAVSTEQVLVGAPLYTSTVGNNTGAIFVVGCTSSS